MKINIIDTTSTEFNRGSFCYAPYLCFNGLKFLEEDVHLIESFQPEDLDSIPDADAHIVTLWSYPQIEQATLLNHFLPFMFGKDNVYFVGYGPLIDHYGFRHIRELLGIDPLRDETFLKHAMRLYPYNYRHFKRLLLSDCDMHLKHLEKDEKVHPLFTSYGCPNGCHFCPSTKNCGRERVELSTGEAMFTLVQCFQLGVKSIHFTDEDFFFDIERADSILGYIATYFWNKKEKAHLIALGSARAVWEYIQRYGTDNIRNAGLEVIEIGFESGSENLSQAMGVGKSLSDCEKLAKMQDVLPTNIFWLVQTFFPGETIKTLNDTGRFMKEYGFDLDQVVGRLRTNGTKGGLGQFFQPYVGVPIYKTLASKGIFLTERPIRLIPSYLPNSFLDSKINDIKPELFDSALPYLQLYNVTTKLIEPDNLKTGKILREYFQDVNYQTTVQLAEGFAILARMGVIE